MRIHKVLLILRKPMIGLRDAASGMVTTMIASMVVGGTVTPDIDTSSSSNWGRQETSTEIKMKLRNVATLLILFLELNEGNRCWDFHCIRITEQVQQMIQRRRPTFIRM